jgi:hypothetical protein
MGCGVNYIIKIIICGKCHDFKRGNVNFHIKKKKLKKKKKKKKEET